MATTQKKTLKDIEVSGKRVLMRVDFNVPVDADGQITDDNRIRAALESIRYVLSQGGKLILMSHMGRPKGKVVENLRMNHVASRLSELLQVPVKKLDQCIGPEVETAVNQMGNGEVILLENLRFHKEEEANDQAFAKALAKLGDIYVNDAFGTAHRAHASTEGITRYLSPKVAGFLMAKEIEFLCGTLEDPERPYIAILGGAKISGKIDVIMNLMKKVDSLIIGGGMAYTFLKAYGREIGNSLLEEDKILLAKEILHRAIDEDVQLLLPIDHIIAQKCEPGVETQWVKRGGIPTGWMALDIGPDTVEKFSFEIKRAKTIVWNGPMGVFEIDLFSKGTFAIAKLLAESDALTIVGGGDSAAAVEKSGYADRMSHISTGGGASLELLEGKELPGLIALDDA